MLDIDWHGDSYRSVPNFFSSADWLQKFNSGEVGRVFMATVVFEFLSNQKRKCVRHIISQKKNPKRKAQMSHSINIKNVRL